MALAGVFLTFGYAGAMGVKTGVSNNRSQAVLSNIFAAENLTTSGTSTTAAPTSSSSYGTPIVRAYAVADSILSFGTAPNASSTRRAFLPAGQSYDFALQNGDKVFWIAA
jgi:hypothetical protein